MSQNLQLNVILSAVDKLTSPFRNANKQVQQLSSTVKNNRSALSQLQTAYNQNQNAINKYKNTLNPLKQKLAENTAQLKTAYPELRKLENAMKGMKKPSQEFKDKLTTARKAVADLKNEQQKQIAKLKEARATFQRNGFSSAEMARKQQELRAKMKTSTAEINQQKLALERLNATQKRQQAYRGQVEKLKSGSERLQNFGQRTMMTGTATLGAGYMMMRPAFDFEQDFSKVEALTGLSKANPKQAEQLEKLRQQGIDLGANTSFTSGEVAQGQGYLAMAGFNHEQILASMPAVLNMTKAAGIEMGQASDIASDISSGFKIPADEMGRVADVLVNTFSSSNTTLEGLGETMKYLGPIASSTGQDFETMSAMVGLLGNVGIKSTQAGTSLRSAMLRLAAPPKQAAVALKELKVSAKDKKGNMRSLTDILVDVEKATKKMGSGDRMEYYKKIFGTEAATAMVELVGQAGIDGIQKMTDKLKNSAGRAEEVAKVMSDNFWGDVKTLSSAKDAISISIFKEVAPFLRETVQKFTDVLRKINDWIKANPQLTASIIKWTASGAGLMTVLGGLSLLSSYLLYPIARLALGFGHFTGINSLLGKTLSKVGKAALSFGRIFTSWKGLFSGISTTAKYLGKGIFTLCNPLTYLSGAINAIKNAFMLARIAGMSFVATPVGLVITALVAGALLVYKYWDQVKAFFGGFWTGLKQGLSPVIEKFQPLATIFGTIVGWVVDLVKWFMDLFTPIQSTKEGLEEATKAGESFGQGLAAAIDFVTKPLQWLMDSVKWLGDNLANVFNGNNVVDGTGKYIDDPEYDALTIQAKKTEPLKKANKTISLPPQRQQQTKYVQEMYEYASFATGGYTGNGGKYQPAGIVHAGEYVMTKQATSKLGVPLLNALNYGKNALIGTGLGLSVAMAQPIQIDDRPPLKPTTSQMVTQQPMQVSITVNATQGQDPQAIAREVARQLQQLQSQQQAQRRSSLRDRD